MALSLSRYASPYRERLTSILKERDQKEREMSVVMATMTGHPLPEDVVIEILSRLPVKNLLQFKCVCKSWYAIITSPNFISKHLRNYYSKSDDSDCLLVQYCVTQAGELESLELLLDETPKVLSYASLGNMPFYSPFLCGPCDGIFYMYRNYYDFRAFWNPAVNEFKFLPPLPNPPSNFSYSPQYDAYGFGLHPVTKDYEVVVMKDYWREKQEERGGCRYPLRVFVYSSSTGSWRHWGDLSRYYYLQNNKCYICMNGVFFWLGSYEIFGDPEVIISFDMATETCQEIQLPDCGKSYNRQCLATYQDSLAILDVHEKFLHMWTLNERCWVKKFSIGPLPEISYPIGHWKNSKLFLVSDSGELILCDPSTQEISGLGLTRWVRCVGVFAYKESLVLVNNGNGCERHNQKARIDSDFVIRSRNARNEECFLMESYYDGISSLFD